MRVKKTVRPEKKPDSVFARISKQSIKKDFSNNKKYVKEYSKPERIEELKENAERRVVHINENCSYSKYARFIVGKLVRLKSQSSFGGWICEFVFDEDRKALNRAAEWSDNKKEYLFDGVKFK